MNQYGTELVSISFIQGKKLQIVICKDYRVEGKSLIVELGDGTAKIYNAKIVRVFGSMIEIDNFEQLEYEKITFRKMEIKGNRS